MLRGMGQDTSAGPEKLSEPRRLSRLTTGKHTHAHEVNVHNVDGRWESVRVRRALLSLLLNSR